MSGFALFRPTLQEGYETWAAELQALLPVVLKPT
jgi:hypothetical protein